MGFNNLKFFLQIMSDTAKQMVF